MPISPNDLRIDMWVLWVMVMPEVPTFGRSDAFLESSVGMCENVNSTKRPADRHVGVDGPRHAGGDHIWTV